MKTPKVPSDLLQHYRAIAREITSDAKNARKFGYKVDTNGKIAQAMKRAYIEGLESAQDSSHAQKSGPNGGVEELGEHDPLPSHMISSRIQGALHAIGLRVVPFYEGEESTSAAYELGQKWTGSGLRPWWYLITEDGETSEDFGDTTVRQLQKLGLLYHPTRTGEDKPVETWLMITKRGVATYKALFDRPRRKC